MSAHLSPRSMIGQVAIVTGAASGLGLAIAGRLTEEGVRVALWDRDPTGLAVARDKVGPTSHGVVADVTDTKAVRAAWTETTQTLGAPSILVNSAGILGPSAAFANYLEEDWQRVLDVNLNGTFRCCQAAVPDMVAAGYGRIVNIASVAGKDGNPYVAGYVASKAAVIGLTKSMGKELATSGVLVNAIAPSASETAIFGELTDTYRARLIANVPMSRFVAPREIAEMALWLASPLCSFSTGATFDISGGRATF